MPGTTIPTKWAARATAVRCRSSCARDTGSNHRDREEAIARGVEAPFRLVEGPAHLGRLGVEKLGARRHAPGEASYRDEGAGDFAAVEIGIGVPGDQQLFEQRQRRGFAENEERLEDLGPEEASLQLVAADPLEQRDQVARVAGVETGRLDGGGYEGVMRVGPPQVLREQVPGLRRMPFSEGQEREVAAAQGP